MDDDMPKPVLVTILQASDYAGHFARERLLARDEGSLLAMARESEEGKVLVDGEIALTKTLYVCEKPDDGQRKNHHCERRPSSDPRAAVGAGAEGRVRAVGAQAWSAPR